MPTTWGACLRTSCPQGEHLQGRQRPHAVSATPSPPPPPQCQCPNTCLPGSLRQLFPSGGSVRGCIKGIKALGKYVDLKRLNTTGISAGCTADLLVSPPPAPASSPLQQACWGPHSALPVGGTGHDVPRPWLPAPGAPRCCPPHQQRLLRLRLPQHPGQRSAVPQSVPGVSTQPGSDRLLPPSLTLQPSLPEPHLCPALPEPDCSLVWGPVWLEGVSLGPWLGPLT